MAISKKDLKNRVDNLQTEIYKVSDKIDVLAAALGVYISLGPSVQGQIQIPPPVVNPVAPPEIVPF